MGCLSAATALLLFSSGVVHGAEVSRRQATTAKFCDASFGNVCYAQYATPNVVFGIAIPAVDAAPFKTLLKITAPNSAGWAGLAWGGGMTNNPLTVAWPNGNGAMVSSRWAT